MSDTDPKSTARAYFERLLNTGDLDAARSLFRPDVRFHYPLGELEGRAAVETYIAAVRTAFPDIRFVIEDLFGEGDRVACRWRLTATQSGPFRGAPPTGRAVDVPGSTIFRFAGDAIDEMWIQFDPALLV